MVASYRPVNLEEALEIRKNEQTLVFAGGTDLMVKHKTWSGTVPGFMNTILFTGHLAELRQIFRDQQYLHIGAACTLSQILREPVVPEWIKRPFAEMASPAIRNMATIGGNICNASPAGDTLPMLYALDARLTLQSAGNTEYIAIKDFIAGPGMTSLKPDQILTEISIPATAYTCCYYRKVGQRKANSISKISFYAVNNSDTDRISQVKIAFGAVGPVVVRSAEAEALLQGIQKLRISDVTGEITAIYEKLINPIDDLRSSKTYRQKVALRLLEDYLARELGR